VEAGEDGKTVFRVEGIDKLFNSPSSAGMVVMGGKAVNGRRFWSLTEGQHPEAPTAPDAQKAQRGKAKGAKLVNHLPAKGLDEGQHRIWCHACQKSFITSEAEPDACPEGPLRRRRRVRCGAERGDCRARQRPGSW
jgi:hypothetical protein